MNKINYIGIPKISSILLIITILSAPSCSKILTPCNCAEAYVNGNFDLVKECEKQFETLNEAQKEQWIEVINKCVPSEKETRFDENPDVEELPIYILEKIDEINKLNQDLQNIPDSYEMFSVDELLTLERKKIILEKLINLMFDLDKTGYQSQISDYDLFKARVKLQYSGVEMQFDALNEMREKGSLR
jgi:hypothetical protein